MKYYYITFMYGASEKILQNGVIREHPFEWQSRQERSRPGQYILGDWKEITEQEYNLYEQLLGLF